MPHKIIILGGGVAGMSAAHELAERGFAVEVFEQNTVAGGKARSVEVPAPRGMAAPVIRANTVSGFSRVFINTSPTP